MKCNTLVYHVQPLHITAVRFIKLQASS